MAKPAVDGLQKDLEARGLSLVRLSISDAVGLQVAQGFGVRGVPTLVVFDGSGDIGLRQIGHINADEAMAYMSSISSSE